MPGFSQVSAAKHSGITKVGLLQTDALPDAQPTVLKASFLHSVKLEIFLPFIQVVDCMNAKDQSQ